VALHAVVQVEAALIEVVHEGLWLGSAPAQTWAVAQELPPQFETHESVVQSEFTAHISPYVAGGTVQLFVLDPAGAVQIGAWHEPSAGAHTLTSAPPPGGKVEIQVKPVAQSPFASQGSRQYCSFGSTDRQ
jgi:hypothetical protein